MASFASSSPGNSPSVYFHFRRVCSRGPETCRVMQRKKFILFPIVIAIVVMLVQYFSSEKVTNPITGRSARVVMSSQQEEALGLQSYQEVLSQSDVVQSGAEHDLVVKVAERLARATLTTRSCSAPLCT